VGEHVVHQRCAGVGPHAQFQRGVGGAQFAQRRWQVERGEGFHRTDAQFARLVAGLAHGSGGLAFEVQHAAGVVEQHASRGGQFDAAARAEEQFGTQFLLQPADAGGDVGLHGVELARGGEDAAFVDDGFEGTQGEEFHSAISKTELIVL